MSFKRRSLRVSVMCFYLIFLVSVGKVAGKPNENGNDVVNMEIPQGEVQTDATTPPVTEKSDSGTETDRLSKVVQENARKLGEVDWGQADGDNGWEERQKQGQVDQQKEEPQPGSETTHQELNSSQQDIGVVNPEHVLHDDHHGDAHGDVKIDPAQTLEAVIKDGEAKEQAEQETLDSLLPGVLKNVHDGPSRAAAEIMRNQKFGPVDIEEVMHGGHHVHGDDHGKAGQVQGGDVEKIVHGEEGVHDDHDDDHNKNKSLSTLDPDQLMHGEEADHECDGKPCFKAHDKADTINPGGMPPQDPLLQLKLDKPKETLEKLPHGLDPEKELHGDDHSHEHDDDPNYKTKNKITYKDIIDLGLSEEQLKGIDLTKLLEQEKNEFDNWQKDSMSNDDSTYWQQVKDLRREYLQKIYAKIKHITLPEDENQEWEDTDDLVHEGESNVEHEMEMWGRTEPKANRQPYEAIHGRRGMNEEQPEQQYEHPEQKHEQPEQQPEQPEEEEQSL